MSVDVAQIIQQQLDRLSQQRRAVIDPAVHSLEASVIGGILLRPDLFLDIDITADDFSDLRARAVYRAMAELASESTPIDVVSIESELTKMGLIDAVGLAYLGDCAIHVPTPDNCRGYAAQVKEASLARRVYMTLGELIEVGRGHLLSGEEMLNVAVQRLSAIDVGKPDESKQIGELVRDRIVQIEAMAERKANGETIDCGAPTGVAELDNETGGYPYGMLSIVCARPAMGKSSFLLAGAQANARIGNGVHVFSMEDSWQTYADRTISQHSKVPLTAIRRAELDRQDCADIAGARAYYNGRRQWLVNARPNRSEDDIIRAVRKHRKVNNTRFVVIDYATLIRRAKSNEHKREMLERAALAFQIASGEDGIAYVLASQLNRNLESRIDRRPTMADLREAGELEEYCKFMVGLYRGHVYNSPGYPQRNIDYECDVCDQSKQECVHAPTMEEWARTIQCVLLKNSNGKIGSINARWDGPTVSVW